MSTQTKLILCCISLCCLSFLCGFYFFKHAAYFLAVQNPKDTDVIVIEGWLPKKSLLLAHNLVNKAGYKKILTSGGPVLSDCLDLTSSYAKLAADELIKDGVKPEMIVIAPSPASAQDRTFLSAVMVREKLKELKIHPKAINVITADVHARRTELAYRYAFRDEAMDVGVIALEPLNYAYLHWWETSEGAKSVLTELLGWAWMKLYFEPEKLNEREEIWGKQSI